ncbi:uncharacterized protein F5891DRAFT_303905 [Suillus fuscotomentosus]|uniref:Smr domain-containing protein n=1 Tax=Suillus fuscotomentosus TaxID=1912939 RepID=A0AAD4E984_9AGAM|nr:uncharacterized protein F5891DRAFT_303905 [Suillus fuscotomentosus]KAG1900678.1 hypothetical protein F5891DRAFT_303905 [Suillus fuscotomentosus]
METLYIVGGLVVLVALIALIDVSPQLQLPPPPPPPPLGVCSPSDSPYVPTFSQQGSSHQPSQPQLPSPRPAIRYPQTPSKYSTFQASGSSQPSPYQPPLPSAQYLPSATTPLLSRPASVPKPVFYTPQPRRFVARVARVPLVVPVVINSHERSAAKAPEVPVAHVVIDPYEDPKSLRLKAVQEGNRMGKYFKERNEAKARNDQQRIKELTQKGEAHRANMMLLDKEASAKIFQENNQNRRNEVDLHGLYVAEAKTYFDTSVQEAWDRGESSLRVIVGKGNHSDNNVPKIKPAIQAHAESLGLSIEVDPRNEGCLIVSLK